MDIDLPGHGALSRLKHATSDAHSRVEEALQLTDDNLDLGRYLRLLTAMRNVHLAADELLDRFKSELAALGYESAERQRVEWIDLDLKSLGGTLDSMSPTVASETIEAFRVDDIADCLGMIYVIEGSTLGGQIIAPAVARALSLDPPEGHRYYIGHGPDTGSRWKATRRTIEAYAMADTDRWTAVDTMAASANRAFDTILAEAKAQRALPEFLDKPEPRALPSQPELFHIA